MSLAVMKSFIFTVHVIIIVVWNFFGCMVTTANLFSYSMIVWFHLALLGSESRSDIPHSVRSAGSDGLCRPYSEYSR